MHNLSHPSYDGLNLYFSFKYSSILSKSSGGNNSPGLTVIGSSPFKTIFCSSLGIHLHG